MSRGWLVPGSATISLPYLLLWSGYPALAALALGLGHLLLAAWPMPVGQQRAEPVLPPLILPMIVTAVVALLAGTLALAVALAEGVS
jgi:hypothetical protein